MGTTNGYLLLWSILFGTSLSKAIGGDRTADQLSIRPNVSPITTQL